jgi:hypothetical protein
MFKTEAAYFLHITDEITKDEKDSVVRRHSLKVELSAFNRMVPGSNPGGVRKREKETIGGVE